MIYKIGGLSLNVNKLLDKAYNLSILLLVSSFWTFLDKQIFLNISQIIFLGIASIKFFKRRKIEKWSVKYIIWGILWMSFCFFSVFWSVNPQATFQYSMSILQVIMVGILLDLTLEDEKQTCYIEKIIILASILLVIRLVLVTPNNAWGQERLGMELGMHVNNVALNLVISLLFALKYATYYKKKKYWIPIIIFYIFIFMTASKKAIIISVFALIFILPMSKKGFIKKIKYLIIMTIMTLVIFSIITKIPLIFDLAYKRMEGLIALFSGIGTVDSSTIERQYLMNTAFSIFYKNPIIGVGLDGFRYSNNLGLYAHSNFMEILADCGIIGIVLYYSLHISIIYKVIKSRKINKSSGITIIIICCILIIDIASVSYYSEAVQFLLVLIYILSFKPIILKNSNCEEVLNEK